MPTPTMPETRLSGREMLGYGVGDLACGLMWNTIVMFLMFFYTEIFGLGAAAAGLMLLVARLVDGAADIGIGLWVDRTNTRFGRCRPFLLFGAPALAALAMACFFVPDLSPNGKLLYAGLTYTGMMLCYSLVNIPYGALPVLMTPVPAERTRMAGVRMACATVGWMVVSGLTLPLVQQFGGGNKQQGYFLTMVLFASTALLLLWLCYGSVRERVPPQATHTDPKGDLRVLLRSRSWWALAGAAMAMFIAVLMPAGCVMYYFTYVMKNPGLASAYFLMGNVANLLGIAVSDQLTRRYCKLEVMKWLLIPKALAPLGFLFIDPTLVWPVFVVGFLAAFFGMMSAPIFHSMVADTSDSIELASGRRVVGLSASAMSLAVKLGAGLGSALAGAILASAGYQAGQDQTPQALQAIVLCMSVGPCLAFLLARALLHFYPLGREQLADMQSSLAARRQMPTAPATT